MRDLRRDARCWVRALLQAIEAGMLGQGSVAGDEYEHNMQQARVSRDGTATWVEVCFCETPLQEERLRHRGESFLDRLRQGEIATEPRAKP